MSQNGRPLVGHRIRWPKDSEPTLQCQRCFEFWPITTEFWNPRYIRACAACQIVQRREYQRDRMRVLRADPAYREQERAAKAADYRANADRRRAYQADWYRRKKSTLARAMAAAADGEA